MARLTLEQKFPNAAARKAADETCDKLPDEDAMSTYIQTWIDTYYEVARTLPKGQKREK